MNEISLNLNPFVDREHWALTVLDALLLEHLVNLRVEGHVGVIRELLLVHVFPALIVPDLDIVEDEAEREVV